MGLLSVLNLTLPAGRPQLVQAPDAWQQTQRDIAAGVGRLKTAIRKEFADEAPELIGEIDRSLDKLDGVLDFLDDRLADALRKAGAQADPAARAKEMKNAKTVLADYIGYVGSEPLIAGIDANPFGVQIDLRRKLSDSLRKVALAMSG
jgi:hypothetical protein